MIKRFLFIVISFALVSNVNGQEQSNPSHYVLPEFAKGYVQFKDGRIEETLLNYNSIMEEMVFKSGKEYLAIANIEEVDSVFIQNRIFVPIDKIFYEALVNEKIPLLGRYTCNVLPPAKPAGYGSTSESSSITIIDNLMQSRRAYDLKLPDDYKIVPSTSFFLLADKKLVKISKAKQIISLFPDKENEIKEFIDSHQIDFRNSQDMIDLIEFCNKK